jgi:hypothetical protein
MRRSGLTSTAGNAGGGIYNVGELTGRASIALETVSVESDQSPPHRLLLTPLPGSA